MSQDQDLLISAGHDYDGIKEYDNPLPRWWVYLFYATVVFAPWHLGYFTGKGQALKVVVGEDRAALAWSTGRLDYAALRAEQSQTSQADGQPLSLMAKTKDPAAIARGKNLFAANCVACHGDQGQGIVGPNLVDEYWIHGSSPDSIRQSISRGFLEKGMIAWEPVLGKEKVDDLTAYVMSIEGNEVSNPKAPEGEKKD